MHRKFLNLEGRDVKKCVLIFDFVKFQNPVPSDPGGLLTSNIFFWHLWEVFYQYITQNYSLETFESNENCPNERGGGGGRKAFRPQGSAKQWVSQKNILHEIDTLFLMFEVEVEFHLQVQLQASTSTSTCSFIIFLESMRCELFKSVFGMFKLILVEKLWHFEK